jgi:hypothetical protein
MRSFGERRLTRYRVASVVAAEPRIVGDTPVNNLLPLRGTVLRDWDGSADRGGYGGSRNVSFVSEPFIAA